LRTDAATRFEKGIDISNTVNVLKRAASLIKEIAGGSIASEVVDIYPQQEEKKQVILKFQFLKKLSGKNYHPDTVKGILESLGFSLVKESIDSLTVQVPYHKPDVSLPADVVEEILRIDGLDNIEIPTSITISPSVERNNEGDLYKEKISSVLIGEGLTEILTNSITNSAYYDEEVLQSSVRLMNNLSVELDIMRPSMLQTALEVIAFNINRKNSDLKLFEFGKTYTTSGVGKYEEQNHLCIYITGTITENSWKNKATAADIYYAQGVAETVLKTTGVRIDHYQNGTDDKELSSSLLATINGEQIFRLGKVSNAIAAKFDIKQPVFFVDFNWDALVKFVRNKIAFKEIPKYPAVERDLAMVVPKTMKYQEVKEQVAKLRLNKLQEVKLFDVFESEKLGADKKSLAINFTFLDEEKTLTDKEIDGWMNKIMTTLEKELGAEIRK
jgi:phenylalanyl-tRNA synthetase beta chain